MANFSLNFYKSFKNMTLIIFIMMLLCAVVSFISFLTHGKCEIIQVTIPDGILQGSILHDYDGGQYFAFTRIPYARPPVGEYRFKLAEKNDPWQGILNATQPSPTCIQPNDENTASIGQEDCLYLNVFTRTTENTTLKPVMVYIHGGKFMQGSSAKYKADFLMIEDIVLVTINYRLGVYGFINTIDSKIATEAQMFGNTGFKDQTLAFKWIKENIQYFGGDPNRVTVSGESAGAMALHGHIISPLSTGLFHQAILMSGSTLVPEMQTANDTATPLAQYLGLDTSNYENMMRGLRNASNEDLFIATKALKWLEIRLNQPVLTALVIERSGPNSFIYDFPLKYLRNHKYKQIPLLIGSNNREGLIVYGTSHSQPSLKDLATNIPFYFKNNLEVMDKVREFYNLDTLDGSLSLIDFYTDIWFRYHMFRTAHEHSKIPGHGDIYCYQFSGVGKLNFLKSKLTGVQNMYGACHADELGYLFPISGLPGPGSLEEKLMRTLVKTWSNFVKYGKPSEKLQPFKANVYNYVNITNNGFEFELFDEPSFKFWDNIYRIHSGGAY